MNTGKARLPRVKEGTRLKAGWLPSVQEHPRDGNRAEESFKSQRQEIKKNEESSSHPHTQHLWEEIKELIQRK